LSALTAHFDVATAGAALAAWRHAPAEHRMKRRRFCQLPVIPAVLDIAACAPLSTKARPMPIQPIHPTGLSYAQASLVTGARRLLFVSGQVPAGPDGTVPAAYPDQYRLAWRNVEAQLQAAGMGFDNLVKVTIFLSDRALIAQSGGLRQEILGDRSPALTIVIAGIYDSAWLLEIEAVAAE
jgi:2-iminobutanoate/2-iminopropanoate deaminase